MRNYILYALCLLLFGCCKIYPNELTPKELEINASEQAVEVHATRKIDMIDIVSSTDLYPDSFFENVLLFLLWSLYCPP